MSKKTIWDNSRPSYDHDAAVSTVIGVILIVFLVVALAGVISVFIFGLVSSVEKTAYVVTDSQIINISPGTDGIVIIHRNGDSMYYENQSPDSPYEVRFMIDIGDVTSIVKTDPSLLSSDTTWSPGDQAIIFKRADGYYLTNDPALITGAVPFPAGSASIRIIDNTHNQLIAYQGAGRIGGTGQTQVPTSIPTTAPTTIPTTISTSIPTTAPTTIPTPSQSCINCGSGSGFSVSFTTEVRGPLTIRFKDESSPQPNTRIWSFGDEGSASGELIDHTYPAAGSYQITLTVKRNNSPCTCTLTRWITVG